MSAEVPILNRSLGKQDGDEEYDSNVRIGELKSLSMSYEAQIDNFRSDKELEYRSSYYKKSIHSNVNSEAPIAENFEVTRNTTANRHLKQRYDWGFVRHT